MPSSFYFNFLLLALRDEFRGADISGLGEIGIATGEFRSVVVKIYVGCPLSIDEWRRGDLNLKLDPGRPTTFDDMPRDCPWSGMLLPTTDMEQGS